MRQRLPIGSSSNESEYAGSDVDDGVGSDTDLTDVETYDDEDGEQGEGVEDQAWPFADDNRPPEHYLQQLETFDEIEYTKEDYKENSARLLDRIEDLWNQ